jgi:hypothetical protein
VSASETMDRKSVREFFAFQLNSDDLNPRPIGWQWAIGGLAVGVAIGAFWEGLTGAITLGALGAILGFCLELWLRNRDLMRRRAAKDQNRREFEDLANRTRQIQAADVIKCFLRVFERTQIDRSSLRILDNRYVLRAEQNLFDEETLEQKIGDLIHKSVRLISKGDFIKDNWRTVRWPQKRSEELFFNPIRLVVLFLSESQLIICDVQLDSIDGKLQEQIQRISLSKIVNIVFSASRDRLNMEPADKAKAARDLGYSEEEIKSITSPRKDDPPWAMEEMLSSLSITRTDSGMLTVPIRSEFVFGQHKSALDQDQPLTEEETSVDRMINELNRLVEHH